MSWVPYFYELFAPRVTGVELQRGVAAGDSYKVSRCRLTDAGRSRDQNSAKGPHHVLAGLFEVALVGFRPEEGTDRASQPGTPNERCQRPTNWKASPGASPRCSCCRRSRSTSSESTWSSRAAMLEGEAAWVGERSSGLVSMGKGDKSRREQPRRRTHFIAGLVPVFWAAFTALALCFASSASFASISRAAL